MKKIFQIMGLISLVCFSFFITEKTALVINEMDEIMISIKENMSSYEQTYVNASIDGNNIIPGKSARKVNITKSYKNMKTMGYYSDTLFIYDYTKPKVSIEDNKDKFIVQGNIGKNMVSLIFEIKDVDDVSYILEILNNFDVDSTFFIDENIYDNKVANKIIKGGHNIGILFENEIDYDWQDAIIKKINKQENVFCLNEDKDIDKLNECAKRENYTIHPINISKITPLVDIKKTVKRGSILKLETSRELKKELSTIIIFLKSKGYEITNLEKNIIE